MNKTILTIIIILLTIPLTTAEYWCEKEGYQYCIEQSEIINGKNLTSRIAINLYDTTGEQYDTFAYRGFAIKEFYADIYYEGEELYYIPELKNWNETCDNETMFCKGTKINQTTTKATYTLGKLHEEYKECPLFVSVKCDNKAEWCEWAGVGWLKPPIYDCTHIRVTECFYDEDCLTKQYCDKKDKYDWKTWTCKEINQQNNTTNQERTKRETTKYTIIAKPTSSGYSPTYNIMDAKKNIINIIIDIIKGIGKWFG